MTSASGCPICGAAVARRPATPGVVDPFPFCSARCQLVDLGRWLGEEYRVPDRESVVWAAPEVGDGDPRRGS